MRRLTRSSVGRRTSERGAGKGMNRTGIRERMMKRRRRGALVVECIYVI